MEGGGAVVEDRFVPSLQDLMDGISRSVDTCEGSGQLEDNIEEAQPEVLL